MLCNEVVGFWWGNISHHPWNFSIVNAFSFRKMFFVLTEEDADIVEHNKKTQLINFICNFSTFQITSVSVPFLTYSPPRHGTKTQISPTCKFNSICLTFYHQIMWLFLICLNCFAFWFFFCFFVCDEHFHHIGSRSGSWLPDCSMCLAIEIWAQAAIQGLFYVCRFSHCLHL